jgi:hypothetical protein
MEVLPEGSMQALAFGCVEGRHGEVVQSIHGQTLHLELCREMPIRRDARSCRRGVGRGEAPIGEGEQQVEVCVVHWSLL